MKKSKFIYILILSIFFLFLYCAYSFDLPKLFSFNKKSALTEWEEKIFKNKVLYAVETKWGKSYLSAKSDKACSGLIYKIQFNPKKFPMFSWNWKVTKFPDKNAATVRGGWIERDDYAARVYVIFPSWNFMSIRSIEYVWDESLAEGTIITSPYFGNIKLIVTESGTKNLDKWVFEKRNIYEDYKKAFGRFPASNVGAIALMTDTDNTLSTAEAAYKDIKVGYKNEIK